jgi:hypothetical protein
METLFAVMLLIDAFIADKLAIATLFNAALLDDKLVIEALFDDKLFNAVVTYAVVAALVELSPWTGVGAVNEIVKLLFPDHVLLEPSKLVPAFNDVCTYE